tara:strand:- start:350 stop:1579 length:1230 start_codon:yes stop_codon:yes gene_type:complete
MSQTSQKKYILTYLISIFSLVVVGITLLSTVFPALIISIFGIHSNNLQTFEIGNNALIILLCNVIIITLGILYYKNKLPTQLQMFISKILGKQLSRKLTIIIISIILLVYVIFTAPELFIDEASQAPDYEIFLAAKEIFPFGKTTFTEATEQNDRYVRMILLITSLEIFQNVKVIPFLGSIALLITTYFLTKEITKNRLAGIISLLVLIQSYTFLKYDSFAMYENFWVLFYVLSLYLIFKNFYTSSISYALSILTKAFTAIFLPLSIVFIFYSNLKTKTKVIFVISYGLMFGVIITIWTLDASVYDSIIRFDLAQLLVGLSKTSYQIRFDLLFLVSVLPLTFALIIKAKNGFHIAASILFLITGSIFAGAIVEMLSEHFVILPYRFVPTIVFFAVGVGVLFNHKKAEKL